MPNRAIWPLKVAQVAPPNEVVSLLKVAPPNDVFVPLKVAP